MKFKRLVMLSVILLIGFSFNLAQAEVKLTFNNYLPPTQIGSKNFSSLVPGNRETDQRRS